MADDEDGDDLPEFVRWGSVLLPLADAAPSTAVNMAAFNPASGTIRVVMKSGSTIDFDGAGVAEWASYKLATSKGEWVNDRVHRRAPPAVSGGGVASGPGSAPPLRTRSSLGRK